MTLTEGLMGLAGLVLAFLLIQGLWTSWRARPRRAEPSAHKERAEPSADFEATVEGKAAPQGAVTDAGARLVSSRTRLSIDPLIDAVAVMPLEAPIPGESALAAMPLSRRAGSKPMLIEGLDAETGIWEPPAVGRRYSEFQAGVQMANRAGALNEIEYSEFVQKIQSFADDIGSVPDFSDMIDVVARARELDQFAQAHDAQLALHVVAQSVSWSVGYLQQMAGRHGFQSGALPGQLLLASSEPEGPPLVVISFDAQAALADDPDQAALRRFTVSLDVAQSPESLEPFSVWQRVAAGLAKDMDGSLLDDDDRPVSLQQFASIHVELQRLYKALESRDLAAGSWPARRLFS